MLMARDIQKKGEWALYRFDYVSDKKQKKITKYVGITTKGRKDKIVIGSAFDYKEGASKPHNGTTLLTIKKN